MHGVQIVADRFLVGGEGQTIDLVSGAPVILQIGAGGGAAEQLRWSARCEALHAVHHRAVAPLVDYGGLGESHRFEAWRCGAPWRGAPEEGARARQSASRFFAACHLTQGAAPIADVYECDGRAVVAPDAEAGYPLDPPPGAGTRRALVGWRIEDCGIQTIDRRADEALADLFATLGGSRPHIVSIWGRPGSGRTTAGLRAARTARLNGLVPVGLPVFDRIDHRLVQGRQLCLIADVGDEGRWAGLLSAALGSPRPHVVLRLGRDEASAIGVRDGVGLEPISAERLAAAVRPQGLGGRVRRRIYRRAMLAHGAPGRFAALLWRNPPASPGGRRPIRGRVCSRVAEQSAVYGSDVARTEGVDIPAPGGEERPSAGASPAWPAPGEMAALRRRAEAASALLCKGRHAAAVRQLRQTAGAFSRRGMWAAAAEAALALASALLRRGDARGALAAIEEGKSWTERTRNEAALIDAAVLSGQARIDLARLDEAESVIATALAVARRIGDGSRVRSASLALGRCLFWKGRYADAAAILAGPSTEAESAEPETAVHLLAGAARAAVGLGDLPRAASLARQAAEQASSRRDPSLVARAGSAAAFVHLAAGDADAVARDVRACIDACRSAHDPMRATRARLLLAESDRRCGRPPSPFAARVGRLAPLLLPPLVRARVDLLHALMQASEPEPDTAVRQAGRLGLPALALFGPAANRPSPDGRPWPEASTDDLVGILHLCQTTEDETRVLGEVCARVRRQLHAAAVALFVPDGAGAASVAVDGARIDPAVALRAFAAGIAIAPHRLEDRLESAAPVRYGGAAIGALAARWTIGAPYDLSRAAAVLTMAATASAPVVCAAIARRTRPAPAPLLDLLGVTPQMAELRRAIERAAAAPFAVLIEGESGCGKELVARAIHRTGLRRDRALCTLNCAALPDELVEAELFGHARGAFTGAVHERAGVFEEAHGGTLLLDEVGELSPRAQAKLLRVIQEGELRRIGENGSRRVDVRIVAATNRDLRREAAEGRFRLDLLYRLDVVRLAVPPLRDRREDIPLLAEHFWREATSRLGSRAVLAAATTAALARYDWPGNVRELQNVLAALAVRTPRRGVVTPAALPPQFAGPAGGADRCRLDEARRTFEERFVRAALVRCGGHRTRAAAELGVTRQGLTKLLTRLGIEGL